MKSIVILAAGVLCWAQEQPTETVTSRHMERDLQGPRFDWDSADSALGLIPVARPSGESLVAGTVSLRSLRRKVSKAAKRDFDQAVALSKKADYAGAARKLELAIITDPEFAEAHVNLGAQYLRLGALEKSLAESLRAIELDPYLIVPRVNSAWVYFLQGRDDLVETFATKALRVSPADPGANYVLGLSLMEVPGKMPAALKHLELAAERIPAAARELERVRPGNSDSQGSQK